MKPHARSGGACNEATWAQVMGLHVNMRGPISSRTMLQGSSRPSCSHKDPANLTLACQPVSQALQHPRSSSRLDQTACGETIYDMHGTPFASMPVHSRYAPLCRDTVSVAGTILSSPTFQPIMRLNSKRRLPRPLLNSPRHAGPSIYALASTRRSY